MLCIDCIRIHTEDKSPDHRIIPFQDILANVKEHCTKLKERVDEGRIAHENSTKNITPIMREIVEEM